MNTLINNIKNIARKSISKSLPLYGGVGGGLLSLCSVVLVSSCADWDDMTYNVEKPETIAQYEYLDNYAPLKENVDRSKHPDFKVSGALTASDFSAEGPLFRLAAHNFDEIVAGNAMKMSSCVNDQGTMDFSNVQSFVQAAEDADLSIYGHCLAWHSQQPLKWLNKLLADKELDIDPEAKVEKEDFTQKYTDGPFPYYVMGCAPEVIDGSIHFVGDGNWYQFFCSTGNAMTEGNYVAILRINSSAAGQVQLTVQNGWGSDAQNITATITLKEGWNEYQVALDAIQGGNYDFILKPGTFNATIDLNYVKVVHYESPAVEVEQDAFCQTYTDGDFPYYPMGCTPPVVNGSIHFEGTGAWSQFFCSTGNSLKPGNYRAYVTCSGTAAANFNFCIQNGWGGTDEKITKSLTVKEGWSTAKIDFTLEQGGSYDVIIQPQTYVGTFDLKSIDVKQIVKMNSIPLTDQEKKDTLTWAMNQWIQGMMNATEGKVKSFDLINEAVSGVYGDNYLYLLQGKEALRKEYKAKGMSDDEIEAAIAAKLETDFYWQDYLGAEEYGPIVEKAARDAYKAVTGGDGADLKLFINDYNLEASYDSNKKLESLIYWINRWEAHGRELGYNTKIDGIGSQMHISYYEDEATQTKNKASIQNMLKLMAATGKLVRISELDMGYVDKSGNDVTTADMTAITESHTLSQRIAQEKAMADFYQWIIEQYFEIVPTAQQYGICQWCLTDSPANSSWRGGLPTGLWYEGYQRKPAYGGWAEGLKK